MTEFETEGVLSIAVDQQSLGEAKQQVESEFADVGNVTVDTSGGRAALADGGMDTTGTFSAGAMATLAEQRNDYLEEIVDLLDDGDGESPTTGGGGEGGGAGIASKLLATYGASKALGGSGAAGLAGRAGGVLRNLGGARGVPLQPGRGSQVTEEDQERMNEWGQNTREMLGLGSDPLADMGSDEPAVTAEDLQGMKESISGVEIPEPAWMSTLTQFQWPDPPNLSSEMDWPELPNPAQDFWPAIPNPFGPGPGPGSSDNESGEVRTQGVPASQQKRYGVGSHSGQSGGGMLDVNMDGKITLDDARAAEQDIRQWAKDEAETFIKQELGR